MEDDDSRYGQDKCEDDDEDEEERRLREWNEAEENKPKKFKALFQPASEVGFFACFYIYFATSNDYS